MSNPWDIIVGTDEYNNNYKRIKGLAISRGYKINPDGERVEKVVGLMTINFNEFGKYYCPCKQSHPIDEKKDVTCPCSELDKEINKDGNCFCRLFYRE